MKTGIAANLLALGVLLAWIGLGARSGTEAVRLRNALLLRPSRNEELQWAPPGIPADYRQERAPAPAEFVRAVVALELTRQPDDWGKALRIAAHLAGHAADKGPIRADPLTTYRRIREGYGYCADFVKVFLGLAHAAGLTARQWAFSFDGFGGHGHTVAEVYDASRGKWLMLDVYNNIHFVGPGGEPRSAMEVRDWLKDRGPPCRIAANGPGRPGFSYPEKAVEYYRRGADGWYLWWGNAVFSYYRHPLVRAAGKVSRRLAPLAAGVAGVHPRLCILRTPDNTVQVRRLETLRRQLIGVLAGLALLTVTLVAQLAGTAAEGGGGP
jgi:hypothetical protein